MTDPTPELREQRLAFLHRAYEKAGGGADRRISSEDIAAELGVGEERRDQIVQYLVDEWLLAYGGFGHWIMLTHNGVKEVEAAKRGPAEGTEHFPPAVINNYFFAETVTGSQVQVGASGSTQTMTTASLEDVREVVRQLRAAIGELEFVDDAVTADVAEDVDAAERHLARTAPRRGVARELLTSARHTLEGAAGGVVAENADKLKDVYELLDQAIGALS